MRSRDIIDSLLLEMPQYGFSDSKPRVYRRSTYTRDGQDRYFDINVWASLSNGQHRSFDERLPVGPQLYDEIKGFVGDDGGNNYYYASDGQWTRQVKQVADIEAQQAAKAEKWVSDNEPGSAKISPAVIPIVTGMRLADLTRHLKDVKYVWVSGEDDPASASELIHAFSKEVLPGEKMYKLTPNEHRAFGHQTGLATRTSRSGAIFAIMNDGQKEKLNSVLQKYFRKKASKSL